MTAAAAAHNKGYPYACEIDVSFPTAASASRTRNVLIVDQELGNRVVKTMDVLSTDPRTLRISFQATEAKMLRVAVSGFFDYLTVVLKCHQEFDNIND